MCVGHLIRTDHGFGSFSQNGTGITIDYYMDWVSFSQNGTEIVIDYYTDWNGSTEELHALGRLH